MHDPIPIRCLDCGETDTVTDVASQLAWVEAHPCTAKKSRRKREPVRGEQ